MPECKSCGCEVRVPAGRDFEDGEDDCWECQILHLEARLALALVVAWVDKPTCPGVWVMYNQHFHTVVGVKNPDDWLEEGRRFYGPIPDDTR